MNYSKKEIHDFELMKQNQVAIKNDEPTELEQSVDIVAIDRITRVLEGVTVWIGISNIPRLKRLIAREQRGYGVDMDIIAIASRSACRGDIISLEQEIKI